jgi:5'-nucleotidase
MRINLKPGSSVWLLVLLLCVGSPSEALDVLLTNDDGFEASTLHAVYRVLKDNGYRVIISSETQDNSGKGGSADFFRPIGPLSRDSRAGSVKAGAPGVGNLPGDGNVFYVDSTPVGAALYGIDVAALRVWGKEPDLVISGPNYGDNTGSNVNISGTVNAALICINRGIPAIAVSTDNPRTFKSFEQLTAGDAESEVAGIVLHLVRALERRRVHSHDPIFPQGVGLNVNIPKFAPGTGARLKFKLSRVGAAAWVTPVFVDDLSQDTTARSFGINEPALPGVSLVMTASLPKDHSFIIDKNPSSEQNVVDSGQISVSVIKGNHQANDAASTSVGRKLTRLLNSTSPRPVHP